MQLHNDYLFSSGTSQVVISKEKILIVTGVDILMVQSCLVSIVCHQVSIHRLGRNLAGGGGGNQENMGISSYTFLWRWICLEDKVKSDYTVAIRPHQGRCM